MPIISFTGLLIVAAVAFLAPLLLGLSPLRRLPSVVIEILGGIIIGPSVLGWVKVDLPISILALLGLAFLLFLAGLEVELERLKGRLLTYVALAFLVSLGLALLAGYGFYAAGQVVSPLLIAIILVATALGIVVPILKDAGVSDTDFGQLVIAGAMFAEFGSIILLSLFFSREATSTGAKLVLLGGFVLVAIMCAFIVLRVERSPRIAAVLVRLQDTTAQIRVRGAFALLVAFAALSERLGLETILGAFIAGVILRQIDGDRMLTHPHFRQKLEAIGFGVFIPVFFITSGIQFDLKALIASPATILRVPLFLLALLLIRGVPALLYRQLVGNQRSIIAGLLQATSLSFIVAASQIGLDLGLLTKANVAALIAAGLLSVIIFPIIALTLLRQQATTPGQVSSVMTVESS
ncbi:cation:proton antiporter [Dictyobacter formicarum]|uniref:Sodium:proton antiporter n=1 Tax=Dictyobacter formicarum TaxID=2778368 RepID=A0ABQ3VU63_9CHLR|nr:cation:proton antiporter [Dictyobacter formicarum]GHO89819.1 sodium:proton antiporter [Dictyobacter formicarum]